MLSTKLLCFIHSRVCNDESSRVLIWSLREFLHFFRLIVQYLSDRNKWDWSSVMFRCSGRLSDVVLCLLLDQRLVCFSSHVTEVWWWRWTSGRVCWGCSLSLRNTAVMMELFQDSQQLFYWETTDFSSDKIIRVTHLEAKAIVSKKLKLDTFPHICCWSSQYVHHTQLLGCWI